MSKLQFHANDCPTLGVEIELGLVDAETGALRSASQQLLAGISEQAAERIKPELMQCYIEINTGVCNTVAEAGEDLRTSLAALEPACKHTGVGLLWSATHPFSRWEDQEVSPVERYRRLLNLLQDIGRQLITFGLHVHVAVDSGDKAVMLCDRIMRHLPTLLALSCNSPWWNGRRTGLLSHRSKIMEGLPTAGLPPLMRNWSEYTWLVNHLVDTGFINSIRELWWDVRPHHKFGTVEVRVCDVPATLDDVLGITALVQSLVVALSEQIDDGTYQHDCHPMMVQQNKWRAARYGLDANLVDALTLKARPARDVVEDLLETLAPTASRLGCAAELDLVPKLMSSRTGAERQLALAGDGAPTASMVRAAVAAAREGVLASAQYS